jgi:hypothetical protein
VRKNKIEIVPVPLSKRADPEDQDADEVTIVRPTMPSRIPTPNKKIATKKTQTTSKTSTKTASELKER